MKRRLLQICIVITGLLLGLRAAALHDGKEPLYEEKLLAARLEHVVTPWDEETTLPAGLLELVEKDIYSLIHGGGVKYLDAYAPDLTEDTEKMQRWADVDEKWEYEYYAGINWACEWPSRDGTENYLVCINDGGTAGDKHIDWYQVPTADGNREEAYKPESWIWTGFGGTYLKVISYDGRQYIVSESRDYDTWAPRGMTVISLGPAGEVGDIFDFNLEPRAESYDCFSLYEEEKMPMVLSEYVEKHLMDILNVCLEERTYVGEETGEFQELSWEGVLDTKYGNPMQIWFEEMDGVTCLFTVEQFYFSDDYLLCVKVISGDSVEEKAVYLLRAGYELNLTVLKRGIS